MLSLPKTTVENVPKDHEVITLGAGCFWCTEAVFQKIKGVNGIMPGYSGGHIEAPSYHEVTTGTTGHAEVIQLFYNPEEIAFQDILEVFWATHDPTKLNRQGADIGPQYRSAIFYHNEEQRIIAEDFKQLVEKAGVYDSPIVTEISPFQNFYPAENMHVNYFNTHENQPYCQFVIRPKLEKVTRAFDNLAK
ncbi:peptide-methionine (S)-S-oxide reductase MsrA [Echinicola marina]|uniref:peptide-methionine (S)-S-oxide reductase MsrA n=1 Tax=Echinicola marina TaxID=2859768 RepID=UPI001CF609CF|nr:peptide-methionine (S)-S-oxide reductase MsrA [Echinicola marina]UCS92529.1 peptide-methionine (S)-S-oxide reductase MsrA [Echinicola marina]